MFWALFLGVVAGVVAGGVILAVGAVMRRRQKSAHHGGDGWAAFGGGTFTDGACATCGDVKPISELIEVWTTHDDSAIETFGGGTVTSAYYCRRCKRGRWRRLWAHLRLVANRVRALPRRSHRVA